MTERNINSSGVDEFKREYRVGYRAVIAGVQPVRRKEMTMSEKQDEHSAGTHCYAASCIQILGDFVKEMYVHADTADAKKNVIECFIEQAFDSPELCLIAHVCLDKWNHTCFEVAIIWKDKEKCEASRENVNSLIQAINDCDQHGTRLVVKHGYLSE